MIAFRLLVILTAAAIAVCAAGYLISGDRRYLGWAVRVIKYAGAAALIFFAVLLLERVV
jgi:threonine/homoserine/homoserine lactone efflux protein